MSPMIVVAATSKGLLTFQRNSTSRLPTASPPCTGRLGNRKIFQRVFQHTVKQQRSV